MASEADSSTIPTSDVIPPMSKNAMKKAAKAKFFAEIKAERRVKEKERKKEKKRQLAERREAGELDEEDEAQLQRMAKKRRLGQKIKETYHARIVFDMGFDEMMADKEIISLTSQLGYVYAANRRASIPFAKLLFTDVNKRTLARLQSMGDSAYLRWDRCEWWDSSYERLWSSTSKSGSDFTSHNTGQTASTTEAELTETPALVIEEPVPQSSVVYLTADSPEELTELKADETYIIGAIVDHNRYKNLCYDKAVASGVRHARLPIGTYLAGMPTRKVLTVNQVFEILVKWIECRDWEQALDAVIPKRKFKSGDKASSHKTEEKDDGSDAELILNECECIADDPGQNTGPIMPAES